jgi:hypothetical protein
MGQDHLGRPVGQVNSVNALRVKNGEFPPHSLLVRTTVNTNVAIQC